jgi:hypothetical protein
MKALVAAAFLASVSIAFAAGNSVDVTLEDGSVPPGPRTIAEAEALGRAEAEKDIKAGHLCVKDYGHPAKSNETDSVTGYPIDYIGPSRQRTFLGDCEITAYNKTMREWHSKHKKRS